MFNPLKALTYIENLAKAISHYPSGFRKPGGVLGNFEDNQAGFYQRNFFDALRDCGFRKTPFQLVFPDQVAGLVGSLDGKKEVHVRFYEDGAVAAEVEGKRFGLEHWDERTDSLDVLEELVQTTMHSYSPNLQEGIRKQFSVKHYESVECEEFGPRFWGPVGLGLRTFFVLHYPVVLTISGYLISEGRFYEAAEPSFIAALETLYILANLELPTQQQPVRHQQSSQQPS
jgi:hypothetical protein